MNPIYSYPKTDPRTRFPNNYDGLTPTPKGITVSYIVSTYNRPWYLECCLASLRCQTDQDFEIIVVDNSTDPFTRKLNVDITDHFNANYIPTHAKDCYHSSAIGAEQTKGEYLCFPSDDSYYTPVFQEQMVRLAREQNLDFVYCGILYNGFWPDEKYAIYPSRPELYHIDKTQYLIRREMFDGFARKDEDPVAADGHIIVDLVKKGARYAKHEGALVVHN